jgi:hypothetical protein
MKTNKTEPFNIINEDGSTSAYIADQLSANLFVSFGISNNQMIGSANLRLHPYTKDDNGNYVSSNLEERLLLVGDVFNSNDRDVQMCVLKINNVIQDLILAKNL